jgi:hypothetical protein
MSNQEERSTITQGGKGAELMAVILNKTALGYAQRLVEHGSYVFDEKDKWSEHQPSSKRRKQVY